MRGLAGAVLAACVLAAGCAAPRAEPLRAIGSDPRLLVGEVPAAHSVTRNVEVREVSHVIVWVPTDGQPPTLEHAISEAIERGRGDVLVNATVERVAWYVPLLYGEYGWVVRGDVVRLRDRRPHRFDLEAAEPPPAPEPGERPASPPPGP